MDFRTTHSTPNVVPENNPLVLTEQSGVKLAAYGRYKIFSEKKLAIRDQLFFGPYLGLFKRPQGDPTPSQTPCQNN